jgi:hypothetical protein
LVTQKIVEYTIWPISFF